MRCLRLISLRGSRSSPSILPYDLQIWRLCGRPISSWVWHVDVFLVYLFLMVSRCYHVCLFLRGNSEDCFLL